MTIIRRYEYGDIAQMTSIWNEVVREGKAFPGENEMSAEEAGMFFESQSYTGVAVNQDTGEIVGLYILHPNNIGRCAHICNTSYAVKSELRGLHIGEQLVKDSLAVGKRLGFRILQFNAVVASNVHALHLYERLGFRRLGTIPGGFLMDDGHYEDIILHYISLV